MVSYKYHKVTIKMTETVSSHEGIELDGLARAVGEQLAAARQDKNVDLKDAARQLRLTTTALLDLERGDLDKLGAPVYTRGYLKSYAALLEVDASVLLDALDRPSASPVEMPNLMRPRRRFAAFDRYARAATYVAGTSLLVIPIYWFIESGGFASLGDGVSGGQTSVEVTLPTSAGQEEGGSPLASGEPTMATMAPFRGAQSPPANQQPDASTATLQDDATALIPIDVLEATPESATPTGPNDTESPDDDTPRG